MSENVRDHGAKGDGVTDDTEAFRRAARAAEMNGGGAVEVPPGTYVVTDLPSGRFEGHGPESRLRKPSDEHKEYDK